MFRLLKKVKNFKKSIDFFLKKYILKLAINSSIFTTVNLQHAKVVIFFNQVLAR